MTVAPRPRSPGVRCTRILTRAYAFALAPAHEPGGHRGALGDRVGRGVAGVGRGAAQGERIGQQRLRRRQLLEQAALAERGDEDLPGESGSSVNARSAESPSATTAPRARSTYTVGAASGRSTRNVWNATVSPGGTGDEGKHHLPAAIAHPHHGRVPRRARGDAGAADFLVADREAPVCVRRRVAMRRVAHERRVHPGAVGAHARRWRPECRRRSSRRRRARAFPRPGTAPAPSRRSVQQSRMIASSEATDHEHGEEQRPDDASEEGSMVQGMGTSRPLMDDGPRRTRSRQEPLPRPHGGSGHTSRVPVGIQRESHDGRWPGLPFGRIVAFGQERKGRPRAGRIDAPRRNPCRSRTGCGRGRAPIERRRKLSRSHAAGLHHRDCRSSPLPVRMSPPGPSHSISNFRFERATSTNSAVTLSCVTRAESRSR